MVYNRVSQARPCQTQFNPFAMKILGIDPGIERLGWAILLKENNKMTAVDYDCLFTKKELSPSKRLEELYDGVSKIIKKYTPEEVAVEDLFFNTNIKTAITVGQARGVIMLAAQKQNLKLFSYTPLAIKMAITGYGRAEKEQMQKMVKNILHLDKIPTPDDTADALAVALTHCFVNKFKRLTD